MSSNKAGSITTPVGTGSLVLGHLIMTRPIVPTLLPGSAPGCAGGEEDYSDSPTASRASSTLAYICILIACPSRNDHT